MNQLIKGIEKKIEINPFVLTGVLYPLKSNNNDSFIEDREAAPDPKVYTNPVRIAKTKRPVKKTDDSSTPPVFEETYFLISDNETLVDIRLEFDYEGMKFKVMKREPLKKHGIIIVYQYELNDITEELTI